MVELGDGAECRQSLLQRDDLKRQVTGRQDQDTHSEKTHTNQSVSKDAAQMSERVDVKILEK